MKPGKQLFMPLLVVATLCLQGCATTTPSASAIDEAELREMDLDVLFATEFPVADKSEALARATAAWEAGDVDRTLFFYVKALQFDPKDADLLTRIGTVHRVEGNAEMAVRAYTMALQENPDHVRALEGRGLVLMAHEREDLALVDLGRAVDLDPSAWRAHNGLGLLADRRGDHRLALKHYDAALELRPDSAVLLNNRGYSRYLAGDYDDAMRDLYTAAEEYGYDRAWLNLAAVYAKLGWYDDAVETYARVHEPAEALQKVAESAADNGDLDVAENLLRRAIDDSPTYLPAAEQSLVELRNRTR